MTLKLYCCGHVTLDLQYPHCTRTFPDLTRFITYLLGCSPSASNHVWAHINHLPYLFWGQITFLQKQIILCRSILWLNPGASDQHRPQALAGFGCSASTQWTQYYSVIWAKHTQVISKTRSLPSYHDTICSTDEDKS